MIGHLILRLAIWFLLTANFSPANIVIGITIAFLLPPRYAITDTLKDWLSVLGKLFVSIPQAYKEAFEIMLHPHNQEEVILERAQPKRSSGLVFVDIFLITFTPKTIVLKYRKDGWYEVHHVQRRKKA